MTNRKENPMTTAKHTPGPWTLEKHNPNAEFTAIGEPIAIVGGEANYENVGYTIGRTCDYGPHGDAMTTANAHLIAAAPELLAACRAAIAEIDPAPDGASLSCRCRACGNHPTKHAPGCVVVSLRAAIRKAEGGAE